MFDPIQAANNSLPKPSRRNSRDVAPAPAVDYETWFNTFRREWKQGEHISVIGTTGTGKTILETELLKVRDHVVFIATKPEDTSLSRLEKRGYVRVHAFPKHPPDDIDRYLLWVPGAGSMSPEAQLRDRAVIKDALTRIFEGPKGGRPGRWAVCIDEARYVSDPAFLGLQQQIKHILIQGRSLKLSLVLGFQRPSWVPAEAYDQPSYLFIAQDNDRRNVQRFREIGGVDGETVAQTVKALRRFEWCFVDARPGGGDVLRITVPERLAR